VGTDFDKKINLAINQLVSRAQSAANIDTAIAGILTFQRMIIQLPVKLIDREQLNAPPEFFLVFHG
jgi:hypothetical protein